jgi:hypothetical protein
MANTATATEFLLPLLFALACRWIKRNPSNFLRFALFPFGGTNVERWPRLMLLLVRGAAILGFLVFVLTALNAVSPISREDLPTGADYLKFAIAVVISFLALRGSAELLPERANPEKQPHAPDLRRGVTAPFRGAKPARAHAPAAGPKAPR